LAEGVENIRVPNRSVTVISPTPALPSDERRPRGRKTGALSKAEQQVVIGNIKEKIPGGLILALEATVEQPDAGVIEQLKFAGSIGPIELMITQKNLLHNKHPQPASQTHAG
jgi:hypothetical protein